MMNRFQIAYKEIGGTLAVSLVLAFPAVLFAQNRIVVEPASVAQEDLGSLAVEGLIDLPIADKKAVDLQELPAPSKSSETKTPLGGVEVLDVGEDVSPSPVAPTHNQGLNPHNGLPPYLGNNPAVGNSPPAQNGQAVNGPNVSNGPRPIFPWEMVTPDSAAQLGRLSENFQPSMDPGLCIVPYQADDFSLTPTPLDPYNPCEEITPYRNKKAVPTQRPWLELGREFYGSGLLPPPPGWLGPVNLDQPQFLVYGDFRTAVGYARNQAGDHRVWANRLNLDFDYRLTSTERFHAFMGPIDDGARFTGVEFDNGDARFVDSADAELDTVFFEGDAGQILGGMGGVQHPFDMPFTVGLAPLLFQNGIWMEDAVSAVAWTIPARNNPNLGWSNFDATFFVGFDQLNSPAFGNDNNAADVFGTAWFIDAYEGYVEGGYAYLDDTKNLGRSYHNATLAFTRRYYHRLSNSVRWIGNFGQEGDRDLRTADGNLILIENALISSTPYTVVPYFNVWCGVGRTQSVARAAGSGGVLRNTGINFETDGLTGFPTLDATGFNTYGGALGLNLLGSSFQDQWVVEFAALGTHGSEQVRVASDNQYALGTRYQRPLNNRALIRTDLMYGWLLDQRDIAGIRVEFRWKF
jgi:hypothetical protein